MRDHARLCEGREYTCTCGYDKERDELISALVAAAQQLLTLGIINPTGSARVDAAIAALRAAVSKAEDAE